MSLIETLARELDEMSSSGTLKHELKLKSPQGPVVEVEGKGEVIMLTSNNYLGLANHPAIEAAAEKAERDYGYGLASVRFICGTQTIHHLLEERIAEFFGTEDTILYGSCWNANEGLFQTIALEQDAIISDELNHASIIDGVRLAKAKKERFKNRDMGDLRRALEATKDARNRVLVTDGVFSMEGSLAPLPEMIDLARQYGAFLVVDDSHGTGVLGARGRGTPEELGAFGKIDAYTSTLGKALGGSHGGFTTMGAAEGLAEGGGVGVDLPERAQLLGRAAAPRAEHAGAVRVVDHQERAVLARQIDHFRQRRQGALHREDAVGHQHSVARVLRRLQRAAQIAHVAILEAFLFRLRQPHAVDDRGVI